MTLKERLDAVWNKNEIACPSHLVQWGFTKVRGHTNYGGSRFNEFNLWYWKGRLLGPKRVKIKGKGFTNLSRNYGLVWATQIGKSK